MDEFGFRRGSVEARYDFVVAAPGVPIDHPDLRRLRENDVEVIGEAEVAFRFRSAPIVGITGTAGKGGTSSLVSQLLTHVGVKAPLGGNFDPPLLDVIDDAEVAVAELSSFQLERVASFRPIVAVVTNLGVDHLDRHGSVEAYHAAKRNITRTQGPTDVLVLPEGLHVPTNAAVARFSNDRIALSDGREVLKGGELPEEHHPANAAAAVLAVEAALKRLGRAVDVAALRDGLLAARPVAGRFETVARRGGVRFVEDSIATRGLAVRAALQRSAAPVAWIVGGRDKGADLAELVDVAREKVSVTVGFGEDGEKFASYFHEHASVPMKLVTARDGEAAMREAVQVAFEALGGAGTVLLAPIGTSFDLYKDYKARGEAFKRAARQVALEVGA